ncbi:hypothetical protein I317_00321 [Kwoniella heveanensis CBS 569]|nr:hypothetical protein I317_00321 [Kwoniella heveanensis CBS 569]
MPSIRNIKSEPSPTPSTASCSTLVLASSPSSTAQADVKPKTNREAVSPSKGWTREQKRQLFYHVLRHGERDFKVAVEGKTGHQEQWK